MNIRQIALLLTACLTASLPSTEARKAPPAQQMSSEPKRVICAPILRCGEQADILVSGASGEPIADCNVKINDSVVKTDASGRATFSVPESDEMVISSEKTGKQKFARSGRIMVLQSIPATIADAICADWTPRNSKTPALLFAPGLIEPGQEFLITGARFPASTSENRVFIDGREAEVLASSPVSMLARAPEFLKPGALRQVFASCGGINTNTFETDVCKVALSWPDQPDPDNSPQPARLAVLGTNMPAVVEVNNTSDNTISFWLPDQKPMGRRGVFLTPGGDNNNVMLQIRRAGSVQPSVKTELLPEVPVGAQLEQNAWVSLKTRHDLCKAQIIRLQRRLIAVQSRLEEVRKPYDLDRKQPEELIAELRELSLRQIRINNMLDTRHALLVALGGTEREYRQTIDDAAGSRIANMEISIQLPKVKTDTSTPVVQENQSPESGTQVRRPRLHRHIEPVIRLLPPLQLEEPTPQAESPAARETKQRDGNTSPSTSPESVSDVTKKNKSQDNKKDAESEKKSKTGDAKNGKKVPETQLKKIGRQKEKIGNTDNVQPRRRKSRAAINAENSQGSSSVRVKRRRRQR